VDSAPASRPIDAVDSRRRTPDPEGRPANRSRSAIEPSRPFDPMSRRQLQQPRWVTLTDGSNGRRGVLINRRSNLRQSGSREAMPAQELNAPHPTTRKWPRETLRPLGREPRAFFVSGWSRRDREKANLRKFRGYSSDCRNQKYEAIPEDSWLHTEDSNSELQLRIKPCPHSP
jgi:hypothetical protein